MEYKCEIVPTIQVLDLWPLVSGYAEKIEKYSYGRFRSSDVLHQMISDGAIVWKVLEDENIVGFLVGKIVEYPERKYLSVDTLSGIRADKWEAIALEEVERVARVMECDGIEADVRTGRDDFETRMSDLGFEKEYLIMTKQIKHEEDSAESPRLEVANG
jgi:hypothetical protein